MMSGQDFKSVIENSSFVRRSLISMFPGVPETELPGRLAEIAATAPDRASIRKGILSGAESEESLGIAMREVRRRVLVGLAARDAVGLGGYPEVVRVMTELAEESIQAAVSFEVKSLASRFGVPMSPEGVPQDLLVVGMGKLGGGELNVSSDIDLIYLYDEDGETRPTEEYPARRSLTNREFFERVGKRVITLLSDIRGCGFVFRVDMRLRPDGTSGPLACSSGMLEEYLYTQGRDWERFAWLKGRIVSSPVFSSEEEFRSQCRSVRILVQPFVYRKYVDFSAISSLASLHAMIRAETNRRELKHLGRGVNVKLGSGGIREIEFIAQTYQLIRGGRDPNLRSRSTLQTLSYLSECGVLTGDVSERLKRSYVTLRNIEHAIQYVDDQQTQLWPTDPVARGHVAALYGKAPDALDQELGEIRNFVKETFDSIFNAQEKETPTGWPEGWETGAPGTDRLLEARIADLGYEHPEQLAARVLALVGSRGTGRSNGALDRLARVIMTVFEHCREWVKDDLCRATPEEALDRGISLLEVIAGRPTYVALLYQYPELLKRVGRILASSRWAAGYLVEHPIILDELLDHRSEEFGNDTPVDWSGWKDSLLSDLEASSDDQERQLNLIRDAHHGAVFRLLMADLDRRLTTERLADHLSALADAVIEIVMRLAWGSIARKPEGDPRFAVIAYGKLGGKELEYASDLDLIYLYDDDRPDSDVAYTRLMRRMMNWLTMQTSSGRLFEVDLRLRPNGADGLLVSPFEAWRKYELNEDGKGAWTWEHQALTRARFCAGDRSIGERFEEERRRILQLPRDPVKLASEIVEMRSKMLAGHENSSGLFDIKQDRGGMVDIEFIVQYLVLSHSADHPTLLGNLGNIRLLSIAADSGLIPREAAEACSGAYRKYREIQRESRLANGDGPVRVEPGIVSKETAAVRSLWRSVLGTDGPEREMKQEEH